MSSTRTSQGPAPTAFVTGGSRGIGRAIAERLAAEGFEVEAPPRARLDLARPELVQAYLAARPGFAPDVLVHCAGINVPAELATLPLETWRATVDTNLTSAYLLLGAIGPAMAARGGGRVVLVSSCYSLLARAGRGAYSASKAGLNALARTAALEYAAGQVLVNAVCPGFVDTELTRQNNTPERIAALIAQIPLGRLTTPQEVAELVLFLASPRNTHLTGQALVLDGGFSIQ